MRDERKATAVAVESKSVVDRIVDTIVDGIRAGRYVPGQRLIETELASETGFSRPTLREALRRLEAEGVVAIERNRGAVVRRFSRSDIQSLYDVREALEPLAARLAAARVAGGADPGAGLQALRRRMSAALEASRLSDYARENARFHALVAEMSGNAWLARMIAMLQLPVDRLAVFHFMTAGVSRGSLVEHDRLVDAITSGKPADAEKAMTAHLRSTRKMIENLPDDAFR